MENNNFPWLGIFGFIAVLASGYAFWLFVVPYWEDHWLPYTLRWLLGQLPKKPKPSFCMAASQREFRRRYRQLSPSQRADRAKVFQIEMEVETHEGEVILQNGVVVYRSWEYRSPDRDPRESKNERLIVQIGDRHVLILLRYQAVREESGYREVVVQEYGHRPERVPVYSLTGEYLDPIILGVQDARTAYLTKDERSAIAYAGTSLVNSA